MDVNTLLAEWSDLLIYSAIAVYAIAFIMYAFDLFGPGFVKEMDADARLGSGAAARSGPAGEKAAGPGVGGAGAAGAGSGSAKAAIASGAVGADSGTATAVLDEEASSGGAGTAAAGAAASGGVPAGGDSAAEDGDSAAGASPSTLRRWARVGTALTVIAAILHLGAIVARTAAVMRVPWSNLMEYALIASVFVAIGYLVLLLFRDVRYLGTMVTGAVLLTLGLCITVFYTPAAGIIPALDNYWIWIHVPIAILSTVLLSLSAFLAAVQILKAWSENRVKAVRAASASGKGTGKKARGTETGSGRISGPLRFVSALPASTELEKISYRLAAVGFVTWTFTLVAGAFWAEIAWGRYWGWDAKEIWTFVVWVVYAAYLHARATRGWTATRVAVLNLIGIATILFNATIVNTYFDGLHSYAGV